MKQYQGGHDETWGGVRINIDRNFLDLGKGSVGRPRDPLRRASPSTSPTTHVRARHAPPPAVVKALQCLLKEQGVYAGRLNGTYTPATIAAARAWQEQRGFTASDSWTRSALDDPASRRGPGRSEVRLRRPGRTPGPARAQRRQQAHPARR